MSKARRYRIKREGLNVHHVLPSSRGGGGRNNLVVLPVEWHASWHKLFTNMTVAEVHCFIDIVMQPDCTWSYKDFEYLRRRLMGGD